MGKGIKAMKLFLAIEDALNSCLIDETGKPTPYIDNSKELDAIREMIEQAEKKEEVTE